MFESDVAGGVVAVRVVSLGGVVVAVDEGSSEVCDVDVGFGDDDVIVDCSTVGIVVGESDVGLDVGGAAVEVAAVVAGVVLSGTD